MRWLHPTRPGWTASRLQRVTEGEGVRGYVCGQGRGWGGWAGTQVWRSWVHTSSLALRAPPMQAVHQHPAGDLLGRHSLQPPCSLALPTVECLL